MTSLALCVIARDEGALLARALNSARGGFDELVVVDTGSIRDVPELRSHGARVVTYRGPLAHDGALVDFAHARNAALAQVRTTWWWWMDADEVALGGTVERLRRHAMERPEPVLNGLTRDGQSRWFRARLVLTGQGHEWVGACHEWVRGPGPTRADPGVVFEHLPRSDRGSSSLRRNYRILRNEVLAGRGGAREAFYLALTLSSLGQHDAAIAAWRHFFMLPRLDAPSTAFGHLYFARLLHTLGRHPEAVAQGIGALRVAPRLAEAACLLGDIAAELGEPVLASAWYARALAAGPCPLGPLFHEPDAYGPYPRVRLRALSGARKEMENGRTVPRP